MGDSHRAQRVLGLLPMNRQIGTPKELYDPEGSDVKGFELCIFCYRLYTNVEIQVGLLLLEVAIIS